MLKKDRTIIEIDLQLDNFMLYCDAKNLSKKTLKSYEQTLILFRNYLVQELGIHDASEVKTSHIRHYIKYLRERGKYTVTGSDKTLNINYPNRREDYKKPISDTTIANYTRNIRVFFNFLKSEREIDNNPMEKIDKIKPKRKKKELLSPEDIKLMLGAYDLSKFHEYRTFIQLKLILDTGLRASECCELMPEDIDFKTKSILVRKTKNGHERYVYFGYKMSMDLKRWIKHRDKYSEIVTIYFQQAEVRN
ncbi:tyrosine-type recombinase/integrase [Ureibacillus sp. FSL E2-3493]|uniref:tyrosine-type recombinase/integrase n=1 Tax=Ureibacillus sp. FSL E2-3493 TaxID=2921367 RepID=UPI00311A295B